MAIVPLEDLPLSLRGQPVPEDDLPGAKPAQPRGERTFGEAAQDIGAGVLGGVGALVQLPGQIGQLAFGMQPGAVTQTGEDIQKYAESLKSPELRAREQERARKVAEAEKSGQLAAFGTAFGETVKDPALLLTFLAEQAPQLLVPFGAARAGVAGARALGAGAGAAGKAGVGAAVGAGAVQQGADVGADAYKAIHDELIKQGASEKEAADGALSLARQAGASAATISLLTQMLPGARLAERVFAGVPVSKAGRLRGAGATALGETISEVPEEVGGKVSSNVAMREVKPEQDILAGTGEAAAMAAIGAGTLGGAVGALSKPPVPEVQPAPEVLPELPTEPQPPSEVQQRVEGITGVTRGEQQTPAAPVMTAEQVAEQRRREIDEAAKREAERAAKEGPRPEVPQPQPVDVSRAGELPKATPRAELEAKQAAIDDMRLKAGLPTSKGVMPETAKPELPTEPKIVDNRPLTSGAAKNRLLVMQNMLKNEGGDPNSLSIVPHPTAKERFAIQSLDRPVQFTPGLPQTAITRPESPKIIDPIDAYINIARQTNTPAARMLVRDYENGVLTRADIGLAVEAERRAGRPLPLNYKGNGEPWFLAPEERKPRGERELPPGAGLTREPPEGPPRPFVGPTGFTPPTKPETPPTGEKPPETPTAEMPKTLAEFKQRMPVMPDVQEVRTANEQGSFRSLAQAMANSQNPVIKRVGELALPLADKITLKRPTAPGKLGGGAVGIYRYADDSIQMDTRYAGSEWVNAHETVHALVARAQRNPSPRQAPYVKQIVELYSYTKKELGRKGYTARNTYGLTNEREFVSEAMSNPDFQYLLMQVPYKGKKSAWTEFVRIVANLLGIQNTNALTEVLNLVDKLAQVKRPIRTPFDRKAVEYAGQEPKFVEDIPNENWLQGKVEDASKRARNQFGVPKMGSTTGYFREGTLYVPTSWAKELKGQRGEQENVRPQDLAAIRKIIRETGKMPLTEDGKEYVPYIEVGYDGVPWVSEGNHRIMAAAAEGLEYIPVEIRYFDGGQRKAGKWAPNRLLETTRNAMQRGEADYSAFPGVTPEQREANFKRWFGDSKVVDKDGKPLVVYHGTNADFRAFRPTRIGEFGPAIYFASTPAEAGAYAGVRRPGQENGAPNIIPVYLSLKNPYTKGVDAFWKEFGRENETDAQAIERAKSAGYDGVIEQKKDWRDKPFQHYIAFSPNQIKSAIGNRGTYGPEAEIDLLEVPEREVSPLGFYSALLEGVKGVSTKAAPAEGWKTMIKGMVNKGAVKAEEVEWSGINDWLDLQQGKVTKEQVADYLRQGGVKVEETVLAEPKGPYLRMPGGAEYGDTSGAKYGQYTLPGGENYREVLLTLPGQITDAVARVVREVGPTVRALPEESLAQTIPVIARDLARRYSLNQAEVESALRQHRIGEIRQGAYKSSHWDQLNVLAHIRVNDRTDADGKRVLFVEEIQSDWGQEGKKKGFVQPMTPAKEARIADLEAEVKAISDSWGGLPALLRASKDDPAAQAARAKQSELRAEIAKIQESAGIVPSGGVKQGLAVPAAPFVTKTEGWLNLALKRVMVMAAEGGYDKVAFVTGEQSADRYDLSKQVDSISWMHTRDGRYDIEADTGRGEPIVRKGLTADELADTVGKDVAQRIVDGVGAFENDRSPLKRGRLSGLDLKVGGEGMKAFYDKIVPLAVKKLLPKLGGGQMNDTTIVLNDNMRVEVAPADRGTSEDDGRGFWLGSKGKAWENQPGFDITPEMRETLSEGVAEFLQLPFGKEESVTPQETGQRAMQIVAATGMTAKPPEPTAAQRVKTAMLSAKDDPKLATSTAKKALQKTLDTVETWTFSGDAKFNNDVRRGVIADLKDSPEVMGMLLEASQSQAVHSDALATQFIIEGGMAYDADTKKWVAIKKEDNFIKLAQKIEALAKKHGLTKEQAERVAHTYFVAKRFRSLAEKQDQRDAEITRLEAEAKREQDPVRKRGLRADIDKLKKAEVYITDQQRALIEPGLSLGNVMPELKDISDTWQAIRVNAVKALVDSGMWNLEYAEAMFDNIDYVPFYREEQLEEGGGPQEFIKGLQVKAKEHRLKGSESPVNDVFDNMVRWTQYAINRAVRNHKALQMIDLGKEINVGDQKMVTQVEKKEKGENVVRVFRDGVQELYSVADPLYMSAFESISNVAIPSLRFFSWASNALRQSVVLYPLFSLAQVPQDAISAIFTSGLKPQYAFRIPVLAVKEFIKTLRKTSATHNMLKQYGAVGVRDFSAAVARQDVEIAAGLKAPKGLGGKIVEGLSHIAMAADNSIRQAVYEASMSQGLSKAEALEKAFEIINFRRRGTSKMINLLGQVVPFFYAYMSVQRVALKTVSGVGISPTTRGEALKTLGYTTAAVMALSLLYAMANGGDEEYEKTPVAIRDRTLHIPGTAARIPLRPDFFLFPKVVTEHLYHLMTDSGLSDGAKFRKSMFDGLVNAIAAPTPIPQAAKPVLEVAINYDFFQSRPIVGPYDQKKEAERQFNDNTSELSKILGEAMGYSPQKLDHLIRGMFGSVGGLTLWMTNQMISPVGDVPRPDKTFQDAIASIPGTSGFVTKTTESRLKNDFYELRDEIVKANETFKDIAKRSPQKLEEFLSDEKNLVRLGLVNTTETITRHLSEIRTAISQTTNLPADVMTAAEKKDFIEQLRAAEKTLMESVDVPGLRKMAQM
jgi:hypothetical protein